MAKVECNEDDSIENRYANRPINVAKFEWMFFEEDERNKRKNWADEMIVEHLVGKKQNGVAMLEHRRKDKNYNEKGYR